VADERRHAVVSGGGTGIGRAAAHALARRGDTVTLLGRREGVLAEAASGLNDELGPGVAEWRSVDLADPEAVAFFASGFDRPVDVIVNAAGGLGRSDGDGLNPAQLDRGAARRRRFLLGREGGAARMGVLARR